MREIMSLPLTTNTCLLHDVSRYVLVSRYIKSKTCISGWREYSFNPISSLMINMYDSSSNDHVCILWFEKTMCFLSSRRLGHHGTMSGDIHGRAVRRQGP
jgi:hypothetical protein